MNATKHQTSIRPWLVLAVVAAFLSAHSVSAQVTSSTSSSSGQATVQTEVKRGEVIYVSGNDVVLKLEDGTVKHLVIPDDKRFNVDGQDLSVHDLKPGMKFEKTVVTTTTPKVVKTVTQAKGKVWYVSGNNLIVSYPGGVNKQYKVPDGTKFNIDGQEKSVYELRKGMNISATVIKEVPETDVSMASNVLGAAPPPPTPAVTAEAPLLIEEAAPAPIEQAAVTPAKLPKTGSELPLIGLVGLISLAGGFATRAMRRLKA